MGLPEPVGPLVFARGSLVGSPDQAKMTKRTLCRVGSRLFDVSVALTSTRYWSFDRFHRRRVLPCRRRRTRRRHGGVDRHERRLERAVGLHVLTRGDVADRHLNLADTDVVGRSTADGGRRIVEGLVVGGNVIVPSAGTVSGGAVSTEKFLVARVRCRCCRNRQWRRRS